MAPKKYLLKELHLKQDWKSTLAIAADLLVISFAIILAITSSSWIIKAFSIILIGMKQYSLGECILHDASHGMLFSNRRLNDLVGKTIALALFIGFNQYRIDHFRHHQHLGDEQDSLAKAYEAYGIRINQKISLSENIKIWVIRPISGFPMWHFNFNRQISDLYRCKKDSLPTQIFWVATVSFCFYFNIYLELFLYWVLPALYIMSIFLYWSEIEDHFNVEGGLTRSNVGILGNVLISHNNGYHELHHKFPQIPWYNLRRAHKLFASEYEGQITQSLLQTFSQTLNFNK